MALQANASLQEKAAALYATCPLGLWGIRHYPIESAADIDVITVGGRIVPSIRQAIQANTPPVFPNLQSVLDGLHPEVAVMIEEAYEVGEPAQYALPADEYHGCGISFDVIGDRRIFVIRGSQPTGQLVQNPIFGAEAVPEYEYHDVWRCEWNVQE